jgi:hypothetical protein
LFEAEPHATAGRRLETEREAAQQTRRSPAYTDVTASHDETISIVHAAIWENERRARLAGNEQAASLWRARELRWQEILQEGNRRSLEYIQQVASWTRTGYRGKRVDDRSAAGDLADRSLLDDDSSDDQPGFRYPGERHSVPPASPGEPRQPVLASPDRPADLSVVLSRLAVW